MMRSFLTATLAASLMLAAGTADAQGKSKKGDKEKDIMSASTFTAMKMRHIGPAFMSGRIADIAIDQQNPSTWYVAVGSGGVWKTVNNGTTWTPIFDKQKVYSTGDVTIDPSNSDIIWVGTGENNGGRHISFGDGVYKSLDGGKTWKNMGLPESERIGDIVIHPDDSDTVWVSAQGPLWTSGGERGLYKTTDGGETWKNTLEVDEWTGVGSLVIDPRNPDRLYAATWARQRTVAAYVGTNKGAGIWTSTDGGETWTKLKTGLPSGNMGKIGLAISPIDPDVVYATVEVDNRKGGLYRSSDRGASWKKMSDEVGGGTGPHYYQELFADPHTFDRIYMVSNYSKYSDDGGKTWKGVNNKYKHVDDHAVAFHPTDPDFMLMGSDGGVYMTHDDMGNWRFMSNLPLTQFYKVALDDSLPFYNIYAGAQDNNTQMGPSRTTSRQGIKNRDWYVVQGGDGHQPATEPGNPDIVYTQWQQGNLSRRDNKTGESLYIKPQAKPGEPAERFNWDAPINVSTHDPKRLYHASQRVWRSDDRGDSWTAISGDLTKNGNRMLYPMMGRTWSVEAGWDLYAMSNYHTIANFSESPVDEDVLWIGTDDGLIQVTTDGGANWKKIDLAKIKGIPNEAYVNDIRADLFDRDTVYVALDDHKNGDFAPYLIKSDDLGKTWESLADTLPEKHLVWRITQDHVNKDLMFLGTEFGVFFTVDGGEKWIELNGGMPTISTRDVRIQRREGDLVAGTFGRGIYILDDYTPLRSITADALKADALLMAPGRDVKLFSLKGSDSGSDGDEKFRAPNPDHGATFTYYLKDSLETLKSKRKAAEKELLDDGKFPTYPAWEDVEAENQEPKPAVYLLITDSDGTVVRRVAAKAKKGLHRVTWDMTDTSTGAVTSAKGDGSGSLVLPGVYTATLYAREGGEVRQLAEPVTTTLVPLAGNAIDGNTQEEKAEFAAAVKKAYGRYTMLGAMLEDARKKAGLLRVALDRATAPTPALESQFAAIMAEIEAIDDGMNGLDARERQGAEPMTVSSHLFFAYRSALTSYGPGKQHREQFGYAIDGMDTFQPRIESLVKEAIPAMQAALQAAGAPWTPGT